MRFREQLTLRTPVVVLGVKINERPEAEAMEAMFALVYVQIFSPVPRLGRQLDDQVWHSVFLINLV